MKLSILALLCGLLTCCLIPPPSAASSGVSCRNEHISLSKNFEGGRFASCKVQSNNVFELSLKPENIPINQSPWYAFEINSDNKRSLTVILNYTHAKNRYWPQLSEDFSNWQRVDVKQVLLSEDEKQLTLQLNVNKGRTWIAAQPVIGNNYYKSWLADILTKNAELSLQEVGKSIQGRSLLALTSKAKNNKPLVVLLGRQHPPEVTGAMAMFSFVDTLLQESEQAKKFRDEINLLIVPNINPDGVAMGNWRHNVAGVDLNRDWGPFSQPETRQINQYIEHFAEDKTLWMVIDFHSTWRDIFYIQKPEQPTRFPELVESWMAAMKKANSPIIFEPKPGHSPDNPTSKTYFYQKYQIPTITYELGDNSKPSDIERSSKIAASTFMQLMLKQVSQ